MFANSGRSTKRLIVGYLGVVMGATLILLSANAGLAAAAPKLDKLQVDGLCTLPNDGSAVLLVGNSNTVDVHYKWDIDKTSFEGEGDAPPGDSYLLVPSSHDNVRIYVDDKQILAPKQDADVCTFHVQPAKRWVDADGHPLDSPDVPKSWKLTLESGDETVDCTWKKGALSCDSDVLDVPFGSTYKVTESATPGFEQKGTGEFGPLQTPPNLTAFFKSDRNIGVTVTNQLAKEEVVIAATTTAATTTAATTTAEDQESTTTAATTTAATTTAEDQESTTTTATTTAATTTAEDQESTTTAATTTAATTTAEDQESTTTTATTIEALTTGESVTTEPTTSEAPTSTLAPTTTLGSTTTPSASTTAPPDETSSTVSESSGGAPSSEALPTDGRAELTGDDADPAAVDPSQDTLPLTGGEAGLVAGLGFALVVAGLGVLGFAWGTATPGRHARRRRVML